MTILTPSPFLYEFDVKQENIDMNGHVNNVVYIQWMQNVAVNHSRQCGGYDATFKLDCSWVVRSHNIEYLKPAFQGDRIIALTWVVDFRKVRSLRRYKFIRKEDETLLARGETDWVFVKSVTGRPCAIPEAVKSHYPLLPDYS